MNASVSKPAGHRIEDSKSAQPKIMYWWVWLILLAAFFAIVIVKLSVNQQRGQFHDLQWARTSQIVTPDSNTLQRGEPLHKLGFEWGSDARWLRATFFLSEAQALEGSPALKLSGVFSATVYVNDQRIGQKGIPALTPEGETIGKIDAVMPLGSAARVGKNELFLLLSAHNAGYKPDRMFHEFAISDQTGGPHRSLARYWIALSQTGVLIIFSGAFLFAALRLNSDRVLQFVAIGSGWLLLALIFETIRVWWNYPYNMQGPRLYGVLLSLIGFGVAVLSATMLNASKRRILLTLVTTILISILIGLSVHGIDHRVKFALTVLYAAIIIMAYSKALNGDAPARAIIGVLGVSLIFMWSHPVQYLDNGVYVLGTLVLGIFTTRAIAVAPISYRIRVDKVEASLKDKLLIVSFEGELLRIPVDKIIAIKAEGNYALIHRIDGKEILVRKSLTDLVELSSRSLLSVHRSYVVNIKHAKSLKAKTGSRYELKLTNNIMVPVSRRLAGAVRLELDSGN